MISSQINRLCKHLTVAAVYALGAWVISAQAISPMIVAKKAEQTDESSSWTIIGNGHAQTYFSPLDGINEKNVSELGVAWLADIPFGDGLSGNPLISDGVVYQSAPMGVVFAHDAKTGALRWRYDVDSLNWGENVLAFWGARVNRGLALIDDNVVFATSDCRIHALNRKTGLPVWEYKSCDPESFYTITAAPRVGNGMVFTGNACVESGANRGFVDAIDAASGKRKWRFYTVPGAPSSTGYDDPIMEMAAETWGEGSWWERSIGCGSVWEGINYDDVTNLVFIGTGGPAPWNPSARGKNAGDELFTNSIVAVNADTGEYVWHFKTTPNDGWNLEASNQMIVTDLEVNGESRRVLLAAPKNGFFYVLDASTGEFLSANNYVDVNWTEGLDPKTGRPEISEHAKWWEADVEGVEVTPSTYGARSWNPMSYSPETGLVYIPASSHSARFAPIGNGMGGVAVDMYIGSRGESVTRPFGELIAWNPVEQELVWKGRERPAPANGGVLSTAGNLVFQATSDGVFEAYAADTGELLWSKFLGAVATAAPSTAQIEGEQFLFLPVGNGSSGSVMMYPKLGALPDVRGASRLLAFKIGGDIELPPPEKVQVTQPLLAKQNEELEDRGSTLVELYMCAGCHGIEGESMNGSVPDLRSSAIVSNFDALKTVVKDGALASRGMPRFRDMPDDDLRAIQAYVINHAWRSYEAQTREESNQE